MSGDRKRILSPFTGRKKRKAWNKTRDKMYAWRKKKILAETDRGSYYKQEVWLEAFFDDIRAFSDGCESDGSDNDDKHSFADVLQNRCS